MSVRASSRPARVPRRSSPAVVDRNLIIVGGLAGIVALGLVIGLAFSGSPGTLAPGTKIDGVAVGGLTAHEAEALLARRSARMARVPVTFTVAGRRFSLRPDELSIAPRWAEAVEAAQAKGAGMDVIRGFRRLALRFSPVDVKPKVSAYDAAVTYELGLIAAKVDQANHPARLVRHGLKLTVVQGQAGRRLDQAAAKALILTSLASLSRNGPVELPTSIDQPSVSAADLAAAQAAAQQALAGPVKVVVGKRHFRVTPKQLAPMLQLPTTKGGSLVLGGAAANAYFSKLNADRRPACPRRPFLGLRRPRLGDPAAAGRRARRAPLGRRPARRGAVDRRAHRAPRGHLGDGRPQHRDGEGDGHHGRRLELRDVLRRHREPHPQRRARRAPDRREADRAGRDVLVQPGDRRPHRGQGLPRGARDHQRRALDRARRRRLPGVDDGLQRGVRGRPADHRAHQPRALHLALPDRPRRDGRLPGHRPQVRERHRPLDAAPHLRRLVVARRDALRRAAAPPRRDEHGPAEAGVAPAGAAQARSVARPGHERRRRTTASRRTRPRSSASSTRRTGS